MSEEVKVQGGEGNRRFKPYPAYRDSGVEWLGEIPAHWKVKRLKRVFFVLNGSTPQSGVAEYWDGDIPWVTPEDLGDLQSSEIARTRRYITRAGYQSCGTTLAPAGSLVLSTRAPIGHLAIAAVELCTNQGCHCLVFRRPLVPKFFYFQLIAARPELESWGQGSTFKELAKTKLENTTIAEPPDSEQRAIAAFLDRETAKIDALVAKKERLIELLQEKRTALITHAVTKGLNPNVPMKYSGVEWLGEIPAHWEVKPLRAVLVRNDSGVWGDDFDDDGIIVLRSTEQTVDGRWNIENPARRRLSAREASKSRLEVGDLVVTKSSGSELHIGKTCIVDEAVAALNCCFSNFMQRLRVSPGNEPRYFWYILNCPVAREQLVFLSSTTTGLGNLNGSVLGAVRVPVPAERDQRAIAAFLDRETAKIGALIAKVREGIERLKEYRTSLISAAVTGKIDVRAFAPLE